MSKLDFQDFSRADDLRDQLDSSVCKLLLAESDKDVKVLSMTCIHLLQQIVQIVVTKRN